MILSELDIRSLKICNNVPKLLEYKVYPSKKTRIFINFVLVTDGYRSCVRNIHKSLDQNRRTREGVIISGSIWNFIELDSLSSHRDNSPCSVGLFIQSREPKFACIARSGRDISSYKIDAWNFMEDYNTRYGLSVETANRLSKLLSIVDTVGRLLIDASGPSTWKDDHLNEQHVPIA